MSSTEDNGASALYAAVDLSKKKKNISSGTSDVGTTQDSMTVEDPDDSVVTKNASEEDVRFLYAVVDKPKTFLLL